MSRQSAASRGRQHALDLRLPLDQRPGVRMEHELQAEAGHELRHLVELIRQPGPGGVVERLGGRPVCIHHDGRHEHVRPRGRQNTPDALGLGARRPRVRLVQHERHEASDEPQPVAVELAAQGARVQR